jgi:hypothetical protein
VFDKKDINRPFLLDILSKYPNVKIIFKKVDLSMRTIHCTLMHSEVPQNNKKALSRVFTQTENLNILPVWDIMEQKWKSFRIENVIFIEDPEKKEKKLKPES